MTMPTIWFVLGTCILLVGCSADRPEQDGSPSQGSPSAHLIEEMRIDGIQHDLVPIGHLGGLVVGRDGTIALRQSQDSKILFYSANGTAAGSFGGPGEGPGEFRGVGRMGWLADTLWVLDVGLRRMTLIAPDLTLVRTILFPTEARPAAADSGRIPGFPFAIPLRPNADGTFLAYMGTAVGQELPEVFRDAAVYGTITGEGVIRAIHAISPRAEGASVRTPTGSVASVPFTHRSLFEAGPDGSRSVLAEGIADGDEAGSVRVTAFDAEGDTLFARVYAFEAAPISQSVRDSTMNAQEKRLRQMSSELADAFRDHARLPENYPAVAGLVVGNDGSVWIERPLTGSSRTYFAIAPDGEPIGPLELPRTSRIAAVERDRIWVLERDENDVESVVRYRIADGVYDEPRGM